MNKLHRFYPVAFFLLIVISFAWPTGAIGQPKAESGPREMVLIAGGTFEMGCVPGDERCEDDERPRHTVAVGSFYIDAREMSYDHVPTAVRLRPTHVLACGTCPVTVVSWYEAEALCRSHDARLPTEAEWEYAARGGRDGAIRYDDVRRTSWTKGNADQRYHPVGTMAPNGFGLYDMLGNVAEWVADRYDPGAYANGTSSATATGRVVRGGSWTSSPDSVRLSNRSWTDPENRTPFIGFRCARDAEGAPAPSPAEESAATP